jgi:hypothetical protein
MSNLRKPGIREGLVTADQIGDAIKQVAEHEQPIEALPDSSAVKALDGAERRRFYELAESVSSPSHIERSMARELRVGIERRRMVIKSFVVLQKQLTDYGWDEDRAIQMTRYTLETQFSLAGLDNTDAIFDTVTDVAVAAQADANAGPAASSAA